MKNVLIAALLLVFIATNAFSANFAPTTLSMSAAQTIQYDFAESPLEIPVDVAGTPAYSVFFVYTKDKASEIEATQNGFLGWHFVQQVDTCIYMSQPTQFSIGSNSITWDGTDNDGNKVPAGEYTYYIWGFDNVNERILACEFLKPNSHTQVLEKDENGNALTNPVFVAAYNRWVLGSDPLDDNYVETTSIETPAGWAGKQHYAIQPDDWDNIYLPMQNQDALTGGLWKYKWVPNGTAERVTDWGEDGSVTWTQPQFYHMNAVTDGAYIYTTANAYKEDYAHNELWVVDMEEGFLEAELDITEFWADLDDYESGAQMNGGPGTMSGRDNLLFLGCHCSCLRQVLDPSRGLDDGEEIVVYVNDNGDYVLDHNFEEDADKPWVCNDFNVGPYTYTFNADANYFSYCPAFDMGAVSFGALAPDGTGIGYFAFAGETANQKHGATLCDNGGPFDGYYVTKNESLPPDGATSTLNGTWYAASESIKGTITSVQIAVDEDTPAAFAVAQNTPNPFNPATTINFTIAEASDVSIDIFNVAGQKVDTIANEYLSAGSHTVTWDASGFSAGIYFYTVKSGDFSKTMKMTLLK